MIDIAGRIDEELRGNEVQEIIRVINNYSQVLDLLDDYDHKRITKPKGTTNSDKINYDDCISIINELRFSNEFFELE